MTGQFTTSLALHHPGYESARERQHEQFIDEIAEFLARCERDRERLKTARILEPKQ